MEKKYYSNSKLETFDQCKLKYKFQYIDKIKVDIPTTIEAFLGNKVHEALQKLYSLAALRTPELKEILEFYSRKWDDEYDQNILIAKQDLTQQDYKKLGEKFLINYYFKHAPFKESQTINLETEEFTPLDEERLYHVRIDRLSYKSGDVFEIHDYKTSNRAKTQEELDKDKQLAMYSIWVKNKFPNAKKIKLIWHYLVSNEQKVSERTPEQLESLKKEILQKTKKIESTNEFPANVTKLCNYCIFQNVCPEFNSS